MSARRFCLAGLPLLLSGCLDQIGALPELPPPPSTILTIDAQSAVRGTTKALRVSLASLPALPMPGEPLFETSRTEQRATLRFPQDIALPESITSADAAFWVEVAALDANGRVLTTARLITSSLPDRTLRPVLTLSDACLDVICGSPSSTCSPQGLCRTAVRAAEDLPSEGWE